MGKALYRKYRSKSLSEVIGQEHITKTLGNAIKNGAISHAYLFTGPRGVGKTSVARILAHDVNKLEYDETATHLDIIEIDAASNRRIDEIRQLRDRIQSAPTQAKYKVYIIDEVHMLTKEAFNALLKTLEEPPEHAIFILATTEAHKVPETIISRTQKFTFRPIELTKVVDHLKAIAKTENIAVDDDALRLIAEHGEGSFRDSISLLDQASGLTTDISLKAIQNMLGIAPADVIAQIAAAIIASDTVALLNLLKQLKIQSYSAIQIASQLSKHYRNELVHNNLSLPAETVTKLLKQLIEVPASHDPDSLLEIILIGMTITHDAQIIAKPSASKPQKKPLPATTEPDTEPETAPPPPKLKTVAPKDQKTEHSHKIDGLVPFDEDLWQSAIKTIKSRYSTLYSVVRMAQPQISGDTLVLSFSFAFHQKRINESKNKQLITDVLKEVTGRNVVVKCIVDSHQKADPIKIVTKPIPKASTSSNPVNTISNIFGSAEVLES